MEFLGAKILSMFTLDQKTARNLSLEANGLLKRDSFSKSQKGFDEVIRRLGYVQIDTINVIERCHHHIFFTRLPDYRKSFLNLAQSKQKSIFEYWTHALAYLPVEDWKYYRSMMLAYKKNPNSWFRSIDPDEYKKVLKTIESQGPLTIRDMKDETLVEKTHLWASRKPSKKILQLGFYQGDLTISRRHQMLKEYDLSKRHFNWDRWPKAETENSHAEYLINRALKSQNLISLESICYLQTKTKKSVLSLLERKERQGQLVACQIKGDLKTKYFVTEESLEKKMEVDPELVHILSPFDPLVIQRKRLKSFFNYDHKFEAYIPAAKRQFGYFALPVLVGDQILALIDFKTDRPAKKLQIQKWTWLHKNKSRQLKALIENEIHRFEKFQLEAQ